LNKVDAMLGGFVLADENHGDVPSIALFQNGVFVYVDFAKSGIQLAQQRRDSGFGFFAEMAAGTRI